jgi:hypothetical protein
LEQTQEGRERGRSISGKESPRAADIPAATFDISWRLAMNAIPALDTGSSIHHSGHSPAGITAKENRALTVTASAPPVQNDEQSHEESQLSYRRSEKTTLFIKTQEGDIVSLKFKTRGSGSLLISDGAESNSTLSVAIGQQSRLAIHIQGDLNSDELAAIKSVVEQASAIAGQFFNGETADAFAAAAALDIDGQQLAQAALGLRLRQSITYTGGSNLPGLVGLSLPHQGATAQQGATQGAGEQAVAATPTDAASGHRSGPTGLPRFVADPQATTTTGPSAPTTAQSAAQATSPAAANPSSSTAVSEVSGNDAVVPPAVESSTNETQDPAPTGQSNASPLNFLTEILDFLTLLIDSFDDVEVDDTDNQPPASTGIVQFSLKLRIFGSILVAIGDAESRGEADGAQEGDTASTVPALAVDAIESLAAHNEPQTSILT